MNIPRSVLSVISCCDERILKCGFVRRSIIVNICVKKFVSPGYLLEWRTIFVSAVISSCLPLLNNANTSFAVFARW